MMSVQIVKMKAKRHNPQIYLPQEWYELVRTSCRSNPFRVIEMKNKDFVAIKELKDSEIFTEKMSNS